MKLVWSNLTKEERQEYMVYQMASPTGYSAYLPMGYTDCSVCSTPTAIAPLCQGCTARFRQLINKLEEK